jgi:CRISPR-associated protein Cas1
VKAEGKIIAKTRLLEVSQVCLFGNVQLSAQLIKVLCDRGIPVCHFSFGNWFYGITHGMSHKNVELRRLQYRLADDEGRAVQIARRMIGGKIRNCRTLLKRNNEAVPQPALDELERMNKLALDSGSWENLLGIEGSASRIYFLHFGGMLKVVDDKGISCFDLDGRNRRPPRDPVNSLLSFLYAILTKDVTVTLLSIGLDPYMGVFHRPRYGRPALALDLMEEFRPIIADSVVVSAINNGEVKIEDFVRKGAGTALVPDGRKKILAAYERRMDTLVTHPIFNYKISYSRLIEVQARLLARSITGEIGSYPPFCTR